MEFIFLLCLLSPATGSFCKSFIVRYLGHMEIKDTKSKRHDLHHMNSTNMTWSIKQVCSLTMCDYLIACYRKVDVIFNTDSGLW